MNKKGFTIVEIIAVIALMATISTIAVVSISSIRSKIAERQYLNLAKTIEAAAEDYSEETGVTKMFVQTLIDKGLVETDDETKIIYDPRNHSALNCQVVKVENNDATLEDKDNPVCDTKILNDNAIKIKYTLASDITSTYKDLPSDSHWFNEPIILSVETTGLVDIDLTGAIYKWTSPLSPDRSFQSQTLRIDNKYVDDIYQVSITAGGKKYTAYGKVKIDRESPKVFNLIDMKPEDWSPNKTLQFELSDAESGIQAYQISLDGTTEPTTWVKVNPVGKKNDKITVTKNFPSMSEGEYIYVWVKDMVGNVNKLDLNANGDGAIQINNIDGNFDKVTLTGTPIYYSQTVTLTGTAQDLKSGLVGWVCSSSKTAPAASSSQWRKVNKTNDNYNITCPTTCTSNGEYYLHAIDAVGNAGTAIYKVSNIDNNIDMVNLIDMGEGSGYREQTTLRGTAYDNKSGIVGYAFSTSASKPSSFTPVNQTNNQITFDYSATKNIMYYFHVIDNAGNWKYDSIKPADIVKKQTYYGTMSDRSSRTITKQIYLNGAVQIYNSYIDNGNINYKLIGNNANVTVSNGEEYIGYEAGTCKTTPSWYSANASLECSGSYKCNNGGTVSGTRCTGSNYILSSNPKETQTYTCKSGSWQKTSGNWPSTSCKPHYSRLGGNDTFNCNGPTGSCTNGATKTIQYGCQAWCYWDGDYNATCSGSTYTKYTCNYNDTRVGSDCYSCQKGTYYNGECQYGCQVKYTYYKYNYTLYYYVLSN